MATQTIRFIGNGQPVNPVKNPRIDREPTKNGIKFSGVTTAREFQQNIRSKLNIPPIEIGKNAVNILRSSKNGFDTTV